MTMTRGDRLASSVVDGAETNELPGISATLRGRSYTSWQPLSVRWSPPPPPPPMLLMLL
jgi:hypothetical protein